MGQVTEPEVPDDAVPVYVLPVLEIQAKARFWARLTTMAVAVVSISSIFLAWNGTIPIWAGVLLVLMLYLPIATETRVVELREKLNLQLRDIEKERVRAAWKAKEAEKSA
ncbi:MAG: hypothetical protein KY455_13545 [Euryarchaeota archaeon]|nr:hypothetical protein [Euryarchaeota archaeon]